MAQPNHPLPSITVSPLACLIARTAYHTLEQLRKEPPFPEPTIHDFLVSVHGLTGWLFAQETLRKNHPQQTHVDIEAFLWQREKERNEVVLNRTLLEKSSMRFVRSQEFKERQRQRKEKGRKTSDL